MKRNSIFVPLSKSKTSLHILGKKTKYETKFNLEFPLFKKLNLAIFGGIEIKKIQNTPYRQCVQFRQ